MMVHYAHDLIVRPKSITDRCVLDDFSPHRNQPFTRRPTGDVREDRPCFDGFFGPAAKLPRMPMFSSSPSQHRRPMDTGMPELVSTKVAIE